MATTSARPGNLDDYATATVDQTPRLHTRADALKAALDAFRSSAGRAEFLDDVPESDLDLRFFGNRWGELGNWLGRVAQAFRDADRDGDGFAAVDDRALGAVVAMYDPTEAQVRFDGNRVIIDAGAGDDDIQVVPIGGGRVRVTINGEEYIFEGEAARNLVVRGNAGEDNIDATGMFGVWSFVAPGAMTLDGGAGNDRIRGARGTELIRGDRGDDSIDGGAGDDTILGGAGNDIIGGGLGDDVIDAGDGNDTVQGGEGRDTIRTGVGNDEIDGGAGNDEIDSGAGNDAVRGGAGDDTIRSGDGRDRVEGGDGHDLIETGAGDDTILGGAGQDTIRSGDGRDYVDGGAGIDSIDAGEGDDVVYGGDGDDYVDGGAGNDYIDGGAGNDRLSGDAGNDVLSGGEGDDTLFGSDGDDTIYAGPGRDYTLGGEGADHLFVEAGDVATAVQPGDRITRVTIDMSLVDNLHIEGPPEFVQRVRADLVTLASSPVGAHMLQELRDSGQPLRITATRPGPGAVGSYGGGEIRYNVEGLSNSGGPRPPVATLFHEMAHAYNDFTDTFVDGVYLGPNQDQVPRQVGFDIDGDGVDDRVIVLDANGDGRVTADELDRDRDGDIDDGDLDLNGDGQVNRGDGWTPNLELQAVGMNVDPDQNPNTPDVPAGTVTDHPDDLTENGLRREMRWPERTHY